MHHKLITCSSSLALYLLALTILSDHLANGNGIVMEHGDGILDHTQSHSSTHHHMDQSTLVFFTPDDLKLGRVLPIYFRGTNPSSSPHFLPREEANLIPFSLSKLDFLVQYFGFSRGSSQAIAMENTLTECGVAKPIRGETKLCATSLESMLDFVHEMLGVTVQVQVLSTQKLKTSATNVLRNYTIVDQPREVEAPKVVACHTMPYPYVIYYCHYQKSESKVFQVSLKRESNKDGDGDGDDDGDGDNVVEAVAVCHMDTSQWSQNHVSFKVLGIKPGTSPVCHFFPDDNLVWVPSSKDDMSLRNHVSPI